MRSLWASAAGGQTKVDATLAGHWVGTGIVFFREDTSLAASSQAMRVL
jgi:hypothetical protein